LADILVVLVATWGSGFLVGTGAFEVTTTTLRWLKDKVLLLYITLQACSVAPLTETPARSEDEKSFQSLQ
jgi:hypothetical protein